VDSLGNGTLNERQCETVQVLRDGILSLAIIEPAQIYSYQGATLSRWVKPVGRVYRDLLETLSKRACQSVLCASLRACYTESAPQSKASHQTGSFQLVRLFGWEMRGKIVDHYKMILNNNLFIGKTSPCFIIHCTFGIAWQGNYDTFHEQSFRNFSAIVVDFTA